jgi:hypothetical protein
MHRVGVKSVGIIAENKILKMTLVGISIVTSNYVPSSESPYRLKYDS